MTDYNYEAKIRVDGADHLSTVDIRTLSRERLEALRQESAEFGDTDLVITCDHVLRGEAPVRFVDKAAEKITDFVIEVPLGRSSTLSTIDLRLMDQDELRALCRNVVDVATPDTPWTAELAAMDYIISGRYAADQVESKAAQTSEIMELLTSPDAQPGPALSTPTSDGEYHGEYHAATLRIAELEKQLVDSHSAFERMDSERQTWRDNYDQEHARLDRFKKKVVKVASDYADRHDWCAVVDKALEELGLERKPQTFTFDVDITLTVRATLANRVEANQIDTEWVRASLYTGQIEEAINDHFEMDSDVEATEITSLEFSISGVTVEES